MCGDRRCDGKRIAGSAACVRYDDRTSHRGCQRRNSRGYHNQLNRHVFHMTQGKMFTTLGLALIDLSSGTARLEYASAGHLDPYIFRNGQVMELQCSSLPLGISPDTVYQGILNTLAPGDIFILYTDGIIESRHASGGMLGFEWWEQELRQLSPYRGLEEQLLRLIKRPQHEEAEELGDDRTLVMVRWNGYTSV